MVPCVVDGRSVDIDTGHVEAIVGQPLGVAARATPKVQHPRARRESLGHEVDRVLHGLRAARRRRSGVVEVRGQQLALDVRIPPDGRTRCFTRTERELCQQVVQLQAEVEDLTQALGEAAVELRVWKKSAEGRLGPTRTSR